MINNALINNNNNYVLFREEINHIIDKYEHAQTFCLTSELGNGKSIACTILALRLRKLGYDVYKINRFNFNYDTFIKEFNYTITQCHQHSKVVLFIDGFYIDDESIKLFNDFLKISNYNKIFFYGRTNEFEINQFKLSKGFDIEIMNFDLLSNEDKKGFIKLLRTYDYSVKDYNKYNEISSILLDCLKSQNIRNRLINEFNNFVDIESKSEIKLLIAISIMKIINLDPFIHDMMVLLPELELNKIKGNFFKRDLRNKAFILNSSVLGIFLLTHEAVYLYVDEVVKTIIENSLIEANGDQNDKYFEIYRRVINFQNLNKIISSGKTIRQRILNIYQFTAAKTNVAKYPQFYVQYALAIMILDEPDLNHANELLKKAEIMGEEFKKKAPDYNLNGIITQRARYNLLLIIDKNECDDFHVKLFDKVILDLTKIIKEETKPNNQKTRALPVITDKFSKAFNIISENDKIKKIYANRWKIYLNSIRENIRNYEANIQETKKNELNDVNSVIDDILYSLNNIENKNYNS